MTHIYILICPITKHIKYVGKSNSPKRRAKDHMLDFRGVPVDRMLWLDEIKRRKLKPILEVIDTINIEEWKYWEEFWISYFKSIGAELFNKRSGNGLTYSNSQTFKIGHIPYNKGRKLK